MTDKDCDQNIEILSSATKNGKLVKKSKAMLELSSSISPVAETSKDQDNEHLLSYESALKSTYMKSLCTEINMSKWSQFCFLLWRMSLQIYRNKVGLKIQFYHHLGCGLGIGLIFWGLAQEGDQFFNHMKFCMGIILFHAYTHCMVPVLSFPFEVKLLKKEHFNQWYSLGPYYMALTVAKVPTISVFSVIFLTIVYTMSGLPIEFNRFILFVIIGVTVSFAADGMGLAIGSVFSVTNGTAVGPLSLAPFIGFAIYGFDFAREIPWYMWPFLKTSFLRSGVVALVITVFGLDRGMLNCSHPMYCHFRDPKVTIHYLDLEGKSPWGELGLLCVMMLAFRLLCYLGLKWRLKT